MILTLVYRLHRDIACYVMRMQNALTAGGRTSICLTCYVLYLMSRKNTQGSAPYWLNKLAGGCSFRVTSMKEHLCLWFALVHR